jgi:hypothetical protein
MKKKSLFLFLVLNLKAPVSAQMTNNEGFYRYNWQYTNPAALNYEYFHRKQNVNGTWYSPRQISVNTTYRKQSMALSQERVSITTHIEYLPSFGKIGGIQRNQANDFRFKMGGGIMDDTWGGSRAVTGYIGGAGSVRLGSHYKLIGGINSGYTVHQLDLGDYKFMDKAEVLELQNELPQPTAIIIPGLLFTDFKNFYVGGSYFYPFSVHSDKQIHLLFGYNKVNERSRLISKRSKNKMESNLIKSLTYDWGVSGWLRYSKTQVSDNLLGKKAPVSGMLNFRGQIPLLEWGRNPLWWNVGANTNRQAHFEIGYTHFAASEYGVIRTKGFDIDWHLGMGLDTPFGKTSQLGTSIEINLGISL